MIKHNLKLKLKKINSNHSKKYQFYNYLSNFKDQIFKKLMLKNNNTIMKIKNKLFIK